LASLKNLKHSSCHKHAVCDKDLINISNKKSHACFNIHPKSNVELLGTVVVKLSNNIEAAFLIDSGSEVSIIEQDLVDSLRINGPSVPLTLVWSGNQTREDKHSRLIKLKTINLTNRNTNPELYFRTVKNLNISSQHFNAKKFQEKYPESRNLGLACYDKISGIIGIDNLFVFNHSLLIKNINKKNFF